MLIHAGRSGENVVPKQANVAFYKLLLPTRQSMIMPSVLPVDSVRTSTSLHG